MVHGRSGGGGEIKHTFLKARSVGANTVMGPRPARVREEISEAFRAAARVVSWGEEGDRVDFYDFLVCLYFKDSFSYFTKYQIWVIL